MRMFAAIEQNSWPQHAYAILIQHKYTSTSSSAGSSMHGRSPFRCNINSPEVFVYYQKDKRPTGVCVCVYVVLCCVVCSDALPLSSISCVW